MLVALGLFAAWVALVLRLEPTRQVAAVPEATPLVSPASTPPAVVQFPSFSGVGGDAALLTAA